MSDWLWSVLVDKQGDSLPMSINSALFVVITAANWTFLIINLIYIKYKKLLWEEDEVASPYRHYIEAFVKDIHGNSKWLRGEEFSSLEKLSPLNIFQTENLKL